MISIIVPVYNTFPYLDQCIRSLIGQSCQDLEIILIDDGSTDGSSEIIKNWAPFDKRIVPVYKTHNTGVSDSRNKGLELSQGEYITFVDSDDYIDSGMIEKMVDAVQRENADLAICEFSYSDPPNKEQEAIKHWDVLEKEDALKFCFPGLGKTLHATSCAKLFRRECLYKSDNGEDRRILSFDESLNYCEDAMWLAQVLLQTDRAVIFHEPLYYYRRDREGNTYTSISSTTEHTVSAIEAYRAIYHLFRENRCSCAKNAFQRMLWHERNGIKIALKQYDSAVLKYCRKKYVLDLFRWVTMQRTKSNLRWVLRQTVWCFLFVHRIYDLDTKTRFS